MRLGLRDFVPPIVLKGQRWIRKRVQTTAAGEQASGYYDKVYGHSEEYGRHYTESIYYASWAVIVDRLRRMDVKRILDIGCGPGQFAAFLRDAGFTDYQGLDFSGRAIEMARQRAPELTFVVGNALEAELIERDGFDVVISLEFLEHVEPDLDVLKRIRAGTRVIATVPNFPSHSHVRHFLTAESVAERYGAVLDDLRVDRVRLNEADTALFLLEGRRRA